MGSALIILILLVYFFKPPINKNDCAKYTLETLYKSSFDSIYSLITTLLIFNNLGSKKSYQIALAFPAHEENQGHFLKGNCFCQVICKYILVIASQKIEALVVHKALQLLIFKANVKTLEKFDIISIAQC